MTDHSRPGAAGTGTPPTTRREARELERRPAAKSPQRRIRAVQKGYATGPVESSPPSRPTSRARSVGSRLLSLAAMVFAGALAVGMSVPANAFGTGGGLEGLLSPSASTSSEKAAGGQSIDVSSTVSTSSASRDEYTVTSWAEMLRLQYGTRDYSYAMGDPNGPIRWPFPYPVPISSGFGERAAPCHGCSSMHMGIDFTPGGGAPIYAIADGVVVESKDDAYGFGNHVIINHGNLLGDGSNIQSLYAHMQHGSVALKVGDQIHVGDFIGTVGMTGIATGNHLHFELQVNNVPVDGFAWLKANT